MKPSSHHTDNKRSLSGFTLLEMMVAMGLGSIILAAACSFFIFCSKSMAGLSNYYDLDRTSRNALDVMTANIRQAHHLIGFATNQLVFTNENGTAFSFTYNASNQTLVATNNGERTVLLTNCDLMNFYLYSGVNTNAGFGFYSTTNISNAKLIEVQWHCYRLTYGATTNADTENIQSAQIVVRN
jgi:prepilin-type N-terminal cleavage/methylation domain-containing protein